MPNSITSSTQLTWSERNGKAIALFGLVVTAFALGFMIASLASVTTPSKDPQAIAFINKNIGQINMKIGLVAIDFVGAGLVFYGAGCYYHHKARKKQEAEDQTMEHKIKASAKNWKTAAIAVGLFVSFIGIGMIASSTICLKYVIPSMKDFANNNVPLSQSLNDLWIGPTQLKLNLLLTGGVFTAIAGGGLMVAGVGTAAIKEKWYSWKARLLRNEATKDLESDKL